MTRGRMATDCKHPRIEEIKSYGGDLLGTRCTLCLNLITAEVRCADCNRQICINGDAGRGPHRCLTCHQIFKAA